MICDTFRSYYRGKGYHIIHQIIQVGIVTNRLPVNVK